MKDKNKHIRLTPTSKLSKEQSTPIQQVESCARSILTHSLDNLFNGCDDLFFDLSSRATSNSEQNLYFESMRELRIKKSGALNNFFQKINEDFDNLEHNLVENKTIKSTANSEILSLVQDDDIERDVAISSMVSKARSNNQEALYHLLIRLDYLIDEQALTDQNNPLDPQQLCNNFADICEMFDIHIKAKIIIYKQFDRLVISQLGKIYATANDLLINAGIIPKISHSIKKDDSSEIDPQNIPAESETTPTNDQPESKQAETQFNELSRLLSNVRRLSDPQTTSHPQYSSNPGPVMSNNELLTALSSLPAEAEPFDADNISNNLHMFIDLILSKSNPFPCQLHFEHVKSLFLYVYESTFTDQI